MQGKWASSHHMDKGRRKSLSKSIFGIKFSQKAEFVHDLNGISFTCSAEVWAFKFLGGLSLHLNHLIASCAANYNWPFGTLPFRLFGSNLDTRDLETYPRTYSGHY